MRKYEKYKNSGIEWIGEIPEHWEVKKIKQFTRILTGSTPKSTEDSYWNGEINWVTTDDLGKLDSKEIFESRRKITQEGFKNSGTYIAPSDSIVLSTRAPIGHIGILKIEACTNQGCKTIISGDNFNSNFLYYYLFSCKSFLNSLGVGTTFLELPTQSLKDFQVPYPCTEEQTAIANYLDRKTAETEELIADKNRLLELYEEEKTALINQAVTKGINPDVQMKDSGIEWLGEIPAHWEVEKLKYVAYSYPSNVDKKSKEGQKNVLLCNYVDVYKNDFITSEIKFMKATATDTQIEKFKLKEGDVIATKDSESRDDIAVPALVKENFENVICGYHLNFIRPINILGEYLFRFFQTEYTKGYFFNAANGITRYGIGTEKFSNFPVCLPPIKEQQSIVRHIDTECTRIDAKKAKTEKLIELLKEYREALISEAVTGKIKVT